MSIFMEEKKPTSAPNQKRDFYGPCAIQPSQMSWKNRNIVNFLSPFRQLIDSQKPSLVAQLKPSIYAGEMGLLGATTAAAVLLLQY